jgi:ABC-type bacteriocin/lantibiotic exporter with double-glycine peptidase domain
MATTQTSPFQKLLQLLHTERHEIRSVYFYAILSGLVALVLPLGTQAIISFVMGGVISVSLVLLIVLVIGATFIIGLLQVNQKKIIEKIEQKIFVRYGFLYSHTIPHLDLRSTQNYYLPELTNRFFDTMTLQKSLAKLLLSIPEAIIQILFGLILLSFYSPVFIVFGLLLLAILGLILRFTGRRGLETSLEESDYKYKVAGFLEELARAPTPFKFQRKTALHLRRTDELISGYLGSRTAHFKILLTQYWTLIIFKVLITTAMLVVGSGLLLKQQLNIGQFVATELVIITVIYSIEKLISSLEIVYDTLTAAEKVNKLPEKPLETDGSFMLTETEGLAIRMKDLQFSYLGEDPILKGVTLTIQSGEKVVLGGDTGSGKSTLLRVISGLLRPTEGALLYNDIPFREYNLDSLRSHISTAFDTNEVFEGTLQENLMFGAELQNINQLKDLATLLGMQDFIFSNPEGLQQPIGMAGSGLSPRIRKKIMLLRALLNSPKLLVLENPEQYLNVKELQAFIRFCNTSLQEVTCIVSSQNPVFELSGMRFIHLDEGLIEEAPTA